MTAPIAIADFESAEEDTVTLLMSQAQERLKQQIELARASDGRAQGMLAVASGFSAAAFSSAVSSWGESPGLFDALVVGPTIAGLFWTLAAIAAMRAMSPVGVHTPGWPPSWVAGDLRARKSYRRIVSEVAVQLDVMIGENRKLMNLNARWTRISILFLMLAPFIGFLAALAAELGVT